MGIIGEKYRIWTASFKKGFNNIICTDTGITVFLKYSIQLIRTGIHKYVDSQFLSPHHKIINKSNKVDAGQRPSRFSRPESRRDQTNAFCYIFSGLKTLGERAVSGHR